MDKKCSRNFAFEGKLHACTLHADNSHVAECGARREVTPHDDVPSMWFGPTCQQCMHAQKA